MNIIFFMAHPGYTRNFEHPIRELARRGHRVHVTFERVKKRLADQGALIESIAAEFPNVTYSKAPAGGRSAGAAVGHRLRLNLDYLRYLEPPFAEAVKLRARAARHATPLVRRLAPADGSASPTRLRLLRALLQLAEQSVPVRAKVAQHLKRHRPDVVLITPLVELGSPQSVYVRAARRAGIRSMLLVASWDNLTTKGLIQEPPDDVFVWNQEQKQEALDLHGLDPERVHVTGAWSYDHWFSWIPSGEREEFCRSIGLDPGRPFIAYLGSSEFIAPEEGFFVARWLRAVRDSHDGQIRSLGVLVRPHPTNALLAGEAGNALAETIRDVGNAVVWPPDGANPTNADLRTQYFDSLHHSAGVVGINTSALIESAIVGKSVLTIRAPEFRGTQDGTLHFAYLAAEGDGFLRIADDFDEHHRQLLALLASDSKDTRAAHFVETFIRPNGIGIAATNLLVDEIETRASQRVFAGRHSPFASFLWPIVYLAHTRLLSQAVRATVRRRRQHHRDGKPSSAPERLVMWITEPHRLRVLRRVPLLRSVRRHLVGWAGRRGT